ncbi:MAG: DUF488 domain-containing protein [Thermorudis peleae]|nr:DUF488 domain-containing protein [Thermorudis peleae]
MKIFTIGFTKKPASKFFGLLRASGAKRLIDIRLNNSSQLAGFTKRDDLEYFLREICNMEYLHLPILAPTPELLDAYRRGHIPWSEYEVHFRELIKQRRIEEILSKELVAGSCFLCSEDKPNHCHRRIVAEYLAERWNNVEIIHLI